MQVLKKANAALKYINRSIRSTSQAPIVPSCRSTPISSCVPQFHKDKEKLGQIQKRATKIVRGLQTISNLDMLNLQKKKDFSLQIYGENAIVVVVVIIE